MMPLVLPNNGACTEVSTEVDDPLLKETVTESSGSTLIPAPEKGQVYDRYVSPKARPHLHHPSPSAAVGPACTLMHRRAAVGPADTSTPHYGCIEVSSMSPLSRYAPDGDEKVQVEGEIVDKLVHHSDVLSSGFRRQCSAEREIAVSLYSNRGYSETATLKRSRSHGVITRTHPSPSVVIATTPSASRNASGNARTKRIDTWMDRIFGMGPEDLETGKIASRMISPVSPFCIGWTIFTAIFLAYTAIVTPPVIAYCWNDPACAPVPTLEFEVAIDIFFLLDIIVQFNIGVRVGGAYIDDRKEVAWLYFTGAFLFDVVTSVPVSFFELAAYNMCFKVSSGELNEADSGPVRFVRSIKPLRWFKVAKILKLKRFSAIIDSISDNAALSPFVTDQVQGVIYLALTLHIFACMWFLWKTLGMTPEELDQWLDKEDWGSNLRHDLQTTPGKVEAYVISLYLVSMTITTIGYGDIHAENTSERVGYTLFFIASAYAWAELIAGVTVRCTARADTEQKKLQVIHNTLNFLQENDCPYQLRMSIIKWTRFNIMHASEISTKKEVIDKMPPDLQKGLVHHLYSDALSRVRIFNYLKANSYQLVRNFLSDVFMEFEYKMFSPGDVLVKFNDPADRLIYFVAGRVDIEYSHTRIHRQTMPFCEGDYIGDMALLGVRDWAQSTRFSFYEADPEPTEIQVTAKLSTFVVVLLLTAAKWEEVLSKSPVTQAYVTEFLDDYKCCRAAIDRENIQCLGNVKKRGQLNISYKERFFVLKDEVLEYYEDKKAYLAQNRGGLKGLILTKNIKVTPATPEGVQKLNDGYIFTITTEAGKTIECACASAAERDMWVHKLQETQITDGTQVNGTRYDLEVTVKVVEHLPKMDLLGTCDTYVKIKLSGDYQKTQTVPAGQSYTSKFDQKFILPWTGQQNLAFQVWDAEQKGADEFVGKAVLLSSSIWSAVQCAELSLIISNNKGEDVVGRDGVLTALKVKLEVIDHAGSNSKLHINRTEDKLHENRNNSDVKAHDLSNVTSLPSTVQMTTANFECRIQELESTILSHMHSNNERFESVVARNNEQFASTIARLEQTIVNHLTSAKPLQPSTVVKRDREVALSDP